MSDVIQDSVGNHIVKGQILRVFHFIGKRHRRHFMYKQVGEVDGLNTKIYHLPYTGKSYSLGAVNPKKDGVYEDAVVVACYCDTHCTGTDLKRSKTLRD